MSRQHRERWARQRTTVRRAGGSCALAGLLLLLLVGLAAPATSAAPPAPGSGRVFLVHALPGGEVSVSVDGARERAVGPGDVVGPLRLAAGRHGLTVTGRDPDWTMDASVRVVPGRSADVVMHASVDGSQAPRVTVFRQPMAGVAEGQARVLLAHTASAPPADVEVDGDTAFTDVANGEFATADIPAGTHDVRLLPAGEPSQALLGPLELETPAGTLTAVYATGDPADGMDVVVHSRALGQRGSPPPDAVETGSAGLVADRPVAGLASDDADAPAAVSAVRSDWSLGSLLVGVLALTVLGRVGYRSYRLLAEGHHRAG